MVFALGIAHLTLTYTPMSESSCCTKCRPASIGKKIIMALSGLVLAGFVLGHMTGNLLVFKGAAAINEYAEWLHAHPGLLWAARSVLIISVIAHIWSGVLLTLENRLARDGGPAIEVTRRASLSSRTMPYSGVVILAFIVFHLLHYTFRTVALGGQEFGANVYGMIVAGFSQPLVAIFYIASMILLCLHLSHGISSVFQTLGLRNERWRGRLDILATLYGWAIALGFISIPLAVLLGRLK
jgi:succinate dehydrogenase / fumarate reductase cytochrome b subunit